MARIKYLGVILTVLALTLLFGAMAYAEGVTDGPAPTAPASPRLIVELESPPLAAAYGDMVGTASADGTLDMRSPGAQTYIAALQAEQAVFVSRMQTALPGARVSTFTNELGAAEPNAYQVVFNGMAVFPGNTSKEEAMRILGKLPGVKGVYRGPGLLHQPVHQHGADQCAGGLERPGRP